MFIKTPQSQASPTIHQLTTLTALSKLFTVTVFVLPPLPLQTFSKPPPVQLHLHAVSDFIRVIWILTDLLCPRPQALG